MSRLLLLLALCAAPPLMPHADGPPPPPADQPNYPADLDWLPNTWIAEQQIERCKEHVERLRYFRCYQPDPRRHDRWIAETEALVRYWGAVKLAGNDDFSEDFRRARLYDLWILTGPERWEKRWTPPLLPGGILPRPRKAVECDKNQ